MTLKNGCNSMLDKIHRSVCKVLRSGEVIGTGVLVQCQFPCLDSTNSFAHWLIIPYIGAEDRKRVQLKFHLTEESDEGSFTCTLIDDCDGIFTKHRCYIKLFMIGLIGVNFEHIKKKGCEFLQIDNDFSTDEFVQTIQALRGNKKHLLYGQGALEAANPGKTWVKHNLTLTHEYAVSPLINKVGNLIALQINQIGERKNYALCAAKMICLLGELMKKRMAQCLKLKQANFGPEKETYHEYYLREEDFPKSDTQMTRSFTWFRFSSRELAWSFGIGEASRNIQDWNVLTPNISITSFSEMVDPQDAGWLNVIKCLANEELSLGILIST